MNKRNEPAFPISKERAEQFTPDPAHGLGLSKREYFAAHSQVDIGLYAASTVEAVIGRKIPDFTKDMLGHLKAWADFEAFLKAMKADALIAALNQQP